jgi:hypothetical protein
MAVISKRVTVGTTAVELFTADTDGNTLYMTLTSNGHIDMGGPSVTVNNGMRLDHGTSSIPAIFYLGAGESIWAVTDTGTETITILITNY